MKFYSTNGKATVADLGIATLNGLAPDGGLYMPKKIGKMPENFFEDIPEADFMYIGWMVAQELLKGGISAEVLYDICEDAFDFPTPVVKVSENTYALELFHGPSFAFKDYGARFMARIMAWLLKDQKKEINILVATSGDTGGAVALGFLDVPGIKVTILYPSGKVSEIQEKQLTTLGKNITALEVNGTFDDCQAMVKQAFSDQVLAKKHNLASANSINICRLIPQSFYYFQAAYLLKYELDAEQLPLVFSVPSGNFGNLFGGLLAWKLGLKVQQFVASTNANDVFTQYLKTGVYNPKPSVQTLSNAMDVGNPSNFARINNLFNGNHKAIANQISGYSFSDTETTNQILKTYAENNYILEPHAAIALLGLEAYKAKSKNKFNGVFLCTAHPAKFLEVMPAEIAAKVIIPEPLQKALKLEKKSIKVPPTFKALKEYLER